MLGLALLLLGSGGLTFHREYVEPHAGLLAQRPGDAQARHGGRPVSFEANAGQTDPRVRFLSRGPGYTLFLTPEEFVLSLGPPSGAKGPSPNVLRMSLTGSSTEPEIQGLERLPGVVSYASGGDPARWPGEVASFGKVSYEGVYPGVDLVFHGERGYLEYDFVVAPGADPSVVAMAFGGAKGLSVGGEGDLVLETASGPVRQEEPFIYQELAGVKQQVSGGYDLRGQDEVGFRLGAYDRTRPLVIDPALPYATYLGGNAADGGTSIAVDAAGSAYVTGWTRSPDFPEKDAAQDGYAGAASTLECRRGLEGAECGDAFVAKLNPEGSGFIYATYLGGSGSDVGYGIAVDGAGAVYVTGQTRSSDFPTRNAFREPTVELGGRGSDAFLAKLDPKGSLVYSTYLGITQGGVGRAVAVDAAGKAYVAGAARSTFPTKNPLQPAPGGGLDAFVAKLDPAASGEGSMVYSTGMGGPGEDAGAGIAVDSAGAAYVTGTAAPGFPTRAPLQASSGGGTDAFVAKLAPDGASLVYSSFLGGSDADVGTAIAVDRSGRAHLAGSTASPNFPTRNAFEPRKRASTDGFVAVVAEDGSGLAYSTYLGGADADASAIALDPSGKAYVAGTTRSDLATKDPLQAGLEGASDAFVAKLDPGGSGGRSLVYSTYLGGGGDDAAAAIALDGRGGAYVTGTTDSRDGFPSIDPLKATLGGPGDAFVAKLADVPEGAPVVTGVNPAGGSAAGGTMVTITGSGFDGATAVRFGDREALGHSVGSKGKRIEVRAPRHPAGTVVVSVVTNKGSSSPVPAARFTYSEGGWARIAGPARFHHTATLLDDGRVLVAGGCLKGGQNGACTEPTDTAELYDPLTRTWFRTGRMTRPRAANHTATLLPSGKVLVTGGDSAELYDPAQGSWVPTGAPSVRFEHSATLLPDGKVLRIDARAGVIELYDVAAGTWSTVGPSLADLYSQYGIGRGTQLADRTGHTATLLPSGKVLVLSGDTAEVLDPATATWAPTAAPEIVRTRETTTLLPTGKVLVVGGLDSMSRPTATTETYDPDAMPDPAKPEEKGAWSAARSIGVARYAHTATLLAGGKVLVAGGSYENRGHLVNGEILDPASGRWSPAGEMSAGRGAIVGLGGASFTATLLNDGSVLLVGGSDPVPKEGVTSGLDSADLYAVGAAGQAPGEGASGPRGPPGAGDRSSDPVAWVAGVAAVAASALVALIVMRRRCVGQSSGC